MIRTLAAMAAIFGAVAAQADTFEERWPTPVEPIVVASIPRAMPFREAHNHYRHHFVCHRVHFTRHHHKYWKCQR
jgi:hypothetical protein